MKLSSKINTEPNQMALQSDFKIVDISNNWSKYTKNLFFFFHKSWMKSLFYENNIVFNGFLRFWGFQKSVWCGFYHIWNWFNQNFENCVMVNSCEFENILDFDIWLESHLVGFCFDFWSKFHLGTKSPMSGKKMSHWASVFVA